MLRSLEDLENYTIFAADGEIGTVVNFLLDDEHWTIRYLIAEANGNSGARDVLISPISIRTTEWESRCFRLAMTRAEVRNSPNIDTDRPILRQHEIEYLRHFGYPCYWGGSSERPADRHLRSAAEVRRYHVEGLDDAIGHIHDFIIDDKSWEIRYLVVVAGNRWHGRKVLLEPCWARRIDWDGGSIVFDLSRQAVKHGSLWEGRDATNRHYEVQLFDYYGHPVHRYRSERT